MRTRKILHLIERRTPEGTWAARFLRRRLALAVVVGVVLMLATALAALASDGDELADLGVTASASGPAHAGSGALGRARDHHGLGAGRGPATGARGAQGQPHSASPEAAVTISSGASLLDIPRSFLGISTEYWALPVFERQMPVLERALSLLRAPDSGPLVLRIGGDSADHSFWDPMKRPMPSWEFAVTPQWLQQTGELVRQLGLKLILDLNLLTDSPGVAAQWARAAETQLPRSSIAAFEVGNEPDIYSRLYWLAEVSHSKVVPPLGLTAESYTRDFQAYARALHPVAPGVPLVGPALANPLNHKKWISTLLKSGPARPTEITVHRYPYSACAVPGMAAYPTIGRVLSENATAGVARSVEPAVAIGRRYGVPVRVTELNSVTCGGRAGVSDAFATALWAPDALFELMRAGVDGVNIHVRARAINAAFSIGSSGLVAKPLMYGLVTFARTLGPGAQLVPLHLQASRALHLKAWGVRVQGNSLHVLLIDKGGRSVDVSLRLPATGTATVQRLVAPSAASRSGVTLGGQYLSADGTWTGRASEQTLRPGVRGYAVSLPRYSAALVTVRLRAGALGGASPRGRQRDRPALGRLPVPAELERRRGETRSKVRSVRT